MPAKSGVAGGVMVVVPNVMGFMLFSPPLDRFGNSVRGAKFCEVGSSKLFLRRSLSGLKLTDQLKHTFQVSHRFVHKIDFPRFVHNMVSHGFVLIMDYTRFVHKMHTPLVLCINEHTVGLLSINESQWLLLRQP